MTVSSHRPRLRVPQPAAGARRALLVLALLLPFGGLGQARAEDGMGAIVRAFCLSAFENEMSRAGKTPPEGMASYACGCVADRLRDGSSLEAARQDCRALTARRYPI